MAEYISKNAIKDAINKKARAEFTLRDDYLQLIRNFQMALDVIENIPAADVKPVKRGGWNWITLRDDFPQDVGEYRCSCCGMERPIIHPLNYCPNCGADMREENDDG